MAAEVGGGADHRAGAGGRGEGRASAVDGQVDREACIHQRARGGGRESEDAPGRIETHVGQGSNGARARDEKIGAGKVGPRRGERLEGEARRRERLGAEQGGEGAGLVGGAGHEERNHGAKLSRGAHWDTRVPVDAPLLVALTLAAFGTATLSATFGMAGGLILMGVYTALLPVPQAMVLHGVTQLVANGGRAWLLRGHVRVDGVRFYLLGAAVAWVALRSVAWVPDEATVYLGIGATPFVALLLPPWRVLDFARRSGATLCGLLVAGTQLAFGVAGPLLDVFFVRTQLLRREVVATKALTQSLSHTLKITYFAPLLVVATTSIGGTAEVGPGTASPLPGLALAGAVTVVGAFAGTHVGGRLLERIGEDTFRRWTRRLVLAIGAIFLVRGLSVLP